MVRSQVLSKCQSRHTFLGNTKFRLFFLPSSINFVWLALNVTYNNGSSNHHFHSHLYCHRRSYSFLWLVKLNEHIEAQMMLLNDVALEGKKDKDIEEVGEQMPEPRVTNGKDIKGRYSRKQIPKPIPWLLMRRYDGANDDTQTGNLELTRVRDVSSKRKSP